MSPEEKFEFLMKFKALMEEYSIEITSTCCCVDAPFLEIYQWKDNGKDTTSLMYIHNLTPSDIDAELEKIKKETK